MNQQELADALGLTPRTVGMWERGEHSPTTKMLALLCGVLGCDVVELTPRVAIDG